MKSYRSSYLAAKDMARWEAQMRAHAETRADAWREAFIIMATKKVKP